MVVRQWQGDQTVKKLIKAVAKYCKEFMLSLNSDSSYLYARNVKGRFKLGEKAISKNSNLSLNYARYVLSGIKSRFKLGEKNYKPIYSELYVGLIPDFRFHESLFWYTYYVIKFNHE